VSRFHLIWCLVAQESKLGRKGSVFCATPIKVFNVDFLLLLDPARLGQARLLDGLAFSSQPSITVWSIIC
jgi:hypothetical protein